MLLCLCPYWLVTVSQLNLTLSSQPMISQLVSLSVKLLLVFTSTVIPGFSVIEIHDEDFYSLLESYMLRNGASSLKKEGSVFLCNHYFCCTVNHAYISAVMASRSLWILCFFCHFTILSNICKRYTEVSCQ